MFLLPGYADTEAMKRATYRDDTGSSLIGYALVVILVATVGVAGMDMSAGRPPERRAPSLLDRSPGGECVGAESPQLGPRHRSAMDLVGPVRDL